MVEVRIARIERLRELILLFQISNQIFSGSKQHLRKTEFDGNQEIQQIY